MNLRENERNKRKQFPENPKIIGREIITDQSDPQMIKYRKQRGELEPGYRGGNTVKLQITEYEANHGEISKVVVGFQDGEPSPQYKALLHEIVDRAMLQLAERKEKERWSQELEIRIQDYCNRDRKAVLKLWKVCELTQPLEDSTKHINRWTKLNSYLFLIGIINDEIVASIMGRCDENRG